VARAIRRDHDLQILRFCKKTSNDQLRTSNIEKFQHSFAGHALPFQSPSVIATDGHSRPVRNERGESRREAFDFLPIGHVCLIDVSNG
jgi:hypothetical protein